MTYLTDFQYYFFFRNERQIYKKVLYDTFDLLAKNHLFHSNTTTYSMDVQYFFVFRNEGQIYKKVLYDSFDLFAKNHLFPVCVVNKTEQLT